VLDDDIHESLSYEAGSLALMFDIWCSECEYIGKWAVIGLDFDQSTESTRSLGQARARSVRGEGVGVAVAVQRSAQAWLDRIPPRSGGQLYDSWHEVVRQDGAG